MKTYENLFFAPKSLNTIHIHVLLLYIQLPPAPFCWAPTGLTRQLRAQVPNLLVHLLLAQGFFRFLCCHSRCLSFCQRLHRTPPCYLQIPEVIGPLEKYDMDPQQQQQQQQQQHLQILNTHIIIIMDPKAPLSYTSSARTSRGRKFPKGKELYSTERICL